MVEYVRCKVYVLVFLISSYEDSRDADVSEELDYDRYRNKSRSPKRVHFEDVMDDSAPGYMEPIRRKLTSESLRNKARTEVRIILLLRIILIDLQHICLANIYIKWN